MAWSCQTPTALHRAWGALSSGEPGGPMPPHVPSQSLLPKSLPEEAFLDQPISSVPGGVWVGLGSRWLPLCTADELL